jgi:NAD/NADP transhydrogenase beta subunit
VDKAKNIIICNWDTKPGYSGVPNEIYKLDKVVLKLGDAKDTVSDIIQKLS